MDKDGVLVVTKGFLGVCKGGGNEGARDAAGVGMEYRGK